MTGWARAAGEAGVPLSRGDSGHSNTPHRASQVAVRAPRLPHLLWGLGSPGQALHTGLYGNQDGRHRPLAPAPAKPAPPRETDSLVTTPRAGWCLSVTRCSPGPLPGGVGCVPTAGSGSPGVTATRGRRGTSPAPSACPALAPISITHIPTTPPGPGAVCGWPRRARPVLLDHREESGPLERVRIKRFQSSCDKTRAGVGVGP